MRGGRSGAAADFLPAGACGRPSPIPCCAAPMAAMEEDATAAIDLTAEPPDVGLAWCFKSPGGFNLTGADPANRAKLKKAFFSPGSSEQVAHTVTGSPGDQPVTPAFPASQS